MILRDMTVTMLTVSCLVVKLLTPRNKKVQPLMAKQHTQYTSTTKQAMIKNCLYCCLAQDGEPTDKFKLISD